MLSENNGILKKSRETQTQTINATVYEKIKLEELAHLTEQSTSKNSTTLVEYLQSKSIIGNEIGENTGKYQINVEKLLGAKQKLGNGDATVELKDVYMLEKQSTSTGSIINTQIATTMPVKIAATETIEIAYKVVYYGNGTSENIALGNLTDSNYSSNTLIAKKDESAKLTEYFSKGPVIFGWRIGVYNNIEPIMDAKDKLKDVLRISDNLIVQYGNALYKIKIVEEPWSATATMIDIDLTEFGEQTIDGGKILVTPSTPDNLVHGNYEGPNTYYKYNEATKEYDIQFTGYFVNDGDRYYRYYNTLGELVRVEEERLG